MLYATSNYQVNKAKHLEWLEKAYNSQSSHYNYIFYLLCRGCGGGLTLLFKVPNQKEIFWASENGQFI